MDQRQIVYEFTRATTLEGWWMWAMVLVGLVMLIFACVRYYRRDTLELSPAIRAALLILRITTIAALIFFFFNLNRRTQRMLTRPSEVAILVDTSQSMSLPSTSEMGSQSRDARAAAILGDSDLVDRLAKTHRVSVYAFGDASEPTLVESIGGVEQSPEDDRLDDTEPTSTASPSLIATLSAGLIALGIVLSIVSLLIGALGKPKPSTSKANSDTSGRPRRSDSAGSATPPVGAWVLAAAVCLILGIVGLGAVACVHTDQSLTAILGVSDVQPDDDQADAEEMIDEDKNDPAKPLVNRVDDWATIIAATALESHIGDALRGVLADHDPSTLAGIVLLSDGQSNGGSDAASAITVASRSEVAVYPVGLGSSDAPVNVRVVDLDAPRRVYPGDKFAVTGVLQASGPEPIAVEVQLIDGLDVTGKAGQKNNAQTNAENAESSFEGRVVDSQRVTVNNDGSLSGIRFEIEPESVGRRRLALRVVAPAGDQNERDDFRSTRYEVVARKAACASDRWRADPRISLCSQSAVP